MINVNLLWDYQFYQVLIAGIYNTYVLFVCKPIRIWNILNEWVQFVLNKEMLSINIIKHGMKSKTKAEDANRDQIRKKVVSVMLFSG